ncbi:hypothetical protein ACG1BZ_05255 [Microbulbifer sp. CNSA002]|uniref:hypothetical protein n=1 Tax=unclassified Microbulbifer TaxID=2619833 RepID=UPI0039B4980D
MRATIKAINPNRGMYAAKIHNDGSYVIFELLDMDEPDLGDEIIHANFYSMGGETFQNITKQSKIEVFIQNVCGANLVRQQLLL